MFRCLAVLVAIPVLLTAGLAHAEDKPRYGPPAKWVQLAEIPAPPDDPEAPAIQAVFDDNQSLHDQGGSAYYNRRVSKVLKTEGLANSGSRTLTWDPVRERVTLHGLAIIRDGRRIDVLGDGKDVLVLRREKNMERAMLDGRMSASIQIKDLQVGDMIDWSYTSERRDPVLGGRTNDFESMNWTGKIGRYRVRLLWDDGVPLVWKASVGFPQTKLSKNGKTNELMADVTGVSAPKRPAGAPTRFMRLGELQATTYRGWEDVSGRMAPLYARAATLDADSPIRAEAAAIAAASADPKVRAFSALKLVEDKTRYLFLGMGDGGYKPAAADETWSRRFGDCKGKTVLLLAILRELGVEAEPVLVMTAGPDGLDQRLPAAAQFNHVLVRARIDGKTYWLDGTRVGDRGGLDALRPPGFLWGLPVRPAGAALEAIEQTPLERPDMAVLIRIDASGGLDKPATTSLTMTIRGDAARGMAATLVAAPRADLERSFKQSFSTSNSWFQVESLDWAVAETGEVTITAAGMSEMEWRMNDDVGVREWRMPGSGAGKPLLLPRRQPGPHDDAPYVTPFPAYNVAKLEVVLPGKGEGFSVKGAALDARVGASQIVRVVELRDGVARFEESDKALAREVAFADAEEVNKVRRRLSQEAQIVRAPKGW